MAANKAFETSTPLQIQIPSNVTFTSGQPILFGAIAGVCNFTAPDTTYPNTSGQMSIDVAGGFNLTVTAQSTLSPAVNSAVAPGDKLYADGGTKDAATGVTYGFTLDKNTGGAYFGTAMDALTTGTTGTIRVRLN